MTTEKCLQIAESCDEFKDKLLIHTTELIEETWCMFNSLTHPFHFCNSPQNNYLFQTLLKQIISFLHWSF